MQALLKVSRLIDSLNEFLGRWVAWLVLAAVVLSAGNAIVRKIFNMSSNSLLELQWYFFSAVFLLCAGYTLLRNEHVRIDIITGRFSARTQTWIDVLGTIFFLMPMAIMIAWLSWPFFTITWINNEISGSAGGLMLWPARILIPVGFVLLALQGVSELVKRIAFLTGNGPDPIQRHTPGEAEKELAEEIRRMAEEKT